MNHSDIRNLKKQQACLRSCAAHTVMDAFFMEPCQLPVVFLSDDHLLSDDHFLPRTILRFRYDYGYVNPHTRRAISVGGAALETSVILTHSALKLINRWTLLAHSPAARSSYTLFVPSRLRFFLPTRFYYYLNPFRFQFHLPSWCRFQHSQRIWPVLVHGSSLPTQIHPQLTRQLLPSMCL